MTDRENNIVYELLTDATTAAGVIDSIKEDNFWIKEFLTDNVLVNGSASEYYSVNPAAGLDYEDRVNNEATKKHEKDKVFKCTVKVLIERTYRSNMSKDQLRISTGSPEKAEMIAALQVNVLKGQMNLDIDQKCMEIVTKKENFAEKSWVEVEEKDFLRALFSWAEKAKHNSKEYNRGRKTKNGSWEQISFAGGKLSNFIIILNTDKKTDVRLEGAKTYNYDLIDLEKEFKAVYDAPFKDLEGDDKDKRIGALILHKDSFALGWQIEPKITVREHPEDELFERASLPCFVVGGPISFANMGAIIIKPTPAEKTTG